MVAHRRGHFRVEGGHHHHHHLLLVLLLVLLSSRLLLHGGRHVVDRALDLSHHL
jgi:hypothetical protein